MQYLKKQKDFLNFFFTFLELRLNFEYFQKKDDPHS